MQSYNKIPSKVNDLHIYKATWSITLWLMEDTFPMYYTCTRSEVLISTWITVEAKIPLHISASKSMRSSTLRKLDVKKLSRSPLNFQISSIDSIQSQRYWWNVAQLPLPTNSLWFLVPNETNGRIRSVVRQLTIKKTLQSVATRSEPL